MKILTTKGTKEHEGKKTKGLKTFVLLRVLSGEESGLPR